MFLRFSFYGVMVECLGGNDFRVGKKYFRLMEGNVIQVRHISQILASKINGSTQYSDVVFANHETGETI